MAKVAITEQYLTDIADAIRTKTGLSTQLFYPSEMAPAIMTISGSGGITPTGTININTNGTHNVTNYASANVSVPNSYSSSDEGKVVSNGALVAQSSATYTENGTYDTTLKNSVTVEVEGGSGTEVVSVVDTTDTAGGTIRTITAVDISDTTAAAADVAQGKYFYTSNGVKTAGTASGGNGNLAEVNDVTFIDYDGRVLYSYTKSEFLALSAMPPNPSHTGLTAQGWNWTLEQAKTFVTANDYLCIGQVYTTADTKTHVIVDIMDYMIGNEFRIRLYTSVKGGTTVDWGDGSTTTPTANANTTTYAAHTYSTAGRYDITVYATSGTYELGYNGSNASVLNINSVETNLTCRYVRALYIGKDCNKLHRSIIGGCTNIEAVTIPKTVVNIGDSGQGSTYLFSDSVKLKSIIIPSEGELATLALAGSLPSLRFISVGYGSVGSNTGGTSITNEVRKLEMLTIGNITSFSNNNQVAYNCRNLTRFAVAGSYTDIYGGYCREVGPTKKVVIPSTVTSIADYALTSSYIEELHFKPTTPPTLANSRGMSQKWGKIYVPYSEDHSILIAYQTATNYTGFAEFMQEEPQ